MRQCIIPYNREPVQLGQRLAQYPTVGGLGASAAGTETTPYSRGGHLRHGQN